MIGILDYGVGNIQAFFNIYRDLDIPCKSVVCDYDFADVSHIILPGVGTFDYAMTALNESGLRYRLDQVVLKEKKPVLGVCVGMQMMGQKSAEGVEDGLGWLNAKSVQIPLDSFEFCKYFPLPHMGWNTLKIKQRDSILNDISPNDYFYFLQSYFLSCDDNDIVLANAEYGVEFTSLVKKNNIYGMLPHPEKSHDTGVKFLKNFWLI